MKIKLSGFWVYARILLICLGLLQAVPDISIAAAYKLDLWLDGNGDNMYGATPRRGGGGNYLRAIFGGGRGAFDISVQNEGDTPDSFELSWDTPTGWYTEIQHQDGSILITCDNRSGTTLKTCTLVVPPSDSPCPYFDDKNGNNEFDSDVDQCQAIAGEIIPLRFVVNPPPFFISGEQSFYIDGSSTGDPTKVDSIRARVWANALTITVSSVTASSATITWPAPSWSANAYDLRYSTKEIIEDGLPLDDANCIDKANCINFSNATAVPDVSFGIQQFTVTKLYANTLYYFALKTKIDVGYTSVLSLCNKLSGVPPLGSTLCPAQTLDSTDTIPPGAVMDLGVMDSTADSVTLCWTAPGDKAFFDDFNDGNLSPWSQLQSGVVDLLNEPDDEWVLRKTTNADPHGGYALLEREVGDFELTLYTKRLTLDSLDATRYSMTDSNGNGYGISLNYSNSTLRIQRRDNWVPSLFGMIVSVNTGLSLGQWYTLRLKREGGTLTAEVFAGKGALCSASPVARVTATDSTYGNFTWVSVNGGYEYVTDNVQVSTPSATGPTKYILKYSTKYMIDNAITPGTGEVTFDEANEAEGIGVPKSSGSIESYKINVKNRLVGNDEQPGTADDIDRTPNTQFFFAIKAQDEQGAQGQSRMSNVAGGLTAMSSQMYNMVSVPRIPNPNTPSAVFGDDVGSPLYLYWWDSRGIGHDRGCYDGSPDQYNPNSEDPPCLAITDSYPISVGNGYFLWSPSIENVLDAPLTSTETSAVTCKDENDQDFSCFIFPLQEGWNMIGNPFEREVNVSAIKVRQTRQQGPNTFITTVPFVTAVTARNWMGNAIYIHNGANYTYEFCDDTGCDPVLQPWKGYWIWLHRQGDGGANTTYELLIPKS